MSPPPGLSYALGQLVATDALTEPQVRTVLANAANSVGLPEHEAHHTISSGIAAGVREPRRAA